MPIILGIILILGAWIAYQKRKSERNSKKNSKIFWDKENQSNLVRKKDLSTLSYITIPYDSLPFKETGDIELAQIQKQLYELREQKIVNLSHITNTDLKLEYGIANLNLLSSYDQNFTNLIRLLNKWANLLYEKGEKQQAANVLEFALSIGSDISSSYTLLAKLYLEFDRKEEISSLITRAMELQTILKDSILDQLYKMYGKEEE
ncbi:MAG TPA: hypothetical protein DHW61_09510 [Lachnoclostridium phytofermentans]|uniref:Uncharacterized protein n=1 Tax=Lachnoclostridium phytofermentans TaxID=66219 RepID=A0A3D2X6M1_9FIRM|nr:hypothetical protein [Lachnoclostridium sp.]HCL02636.1 hypothetical protein [Lachnoclostridium phytofermentans]